MSESNGRAAAAGRRSALHWLLADIALTSPDAAFVARLRRDLRPRNDKPDRLLTRLGQLCACLPPSHEGSQVERLAVDYARLFGGLKEGYGLPPPLESAAVGPLEGPEVAVTLAERYAEAGFPSFVGSAPADHLGIEMKFFSLLCYAEMQALQEGKTTEAARYIALQRQFVGDHLGRWAPDHWRNVAASAEHAFYKLAAEIAAEALIDETSANFAKSTLEDERSASPI